VLGVILVYIVVDVDIITPCTRIDYLDTAYQSILSQKEVTWRWLLQGDRELFSDIPSSIISDSRVVYEENPQSYRAALTRNRALMRGSAPFVFALDDDDLISEGALNALTSALINEDQDCKCFGAWGESHTFTDSEKREMFRSWPRAGIIPSGSLSSPFERGEGLLIHCGSVLWRRKYLVALGGWSGLLHSEDTNLVIAADSIFPSVYVPVPVYEYRLGGTEQVTASDQFSSEKLRRHDFTHERAQALQEIFRNP
jgi:glycosyltransferase involved in cell wall biosynthesis